MYVSAEYIVEKTKEFEELKKAGKQPEFIGYDGVKTVFQGLDGNTILSRQTERLELERASLDLTGLAAHRTLQNNAVHTFLSRNGIETSLIKNFDSCALCFATAKALPSPAEMLLEINNKNLSAAEKQQKLELLSDLSTLHNQAQSVLIKGIELASELKGYRKTEITPRLIKLAPISCQPDKIIVADNFTMDTFNIDYIDISSTLQSIGTKPLKQIIEIARERRSEFYPDSISKEILDNFSRGSEIFSELANITL